jgi:hypothetical protein
VQILLTDCKSISNQYSVYPVCDKSIRNKAHCLHCSVDHSSHLQSFYISSVTVQLQNIPINSLNISLLYRNSSVSMRDFQDGFVFRSIRPRNSNAILTLTMNMQGVQLSKRSQ